MITPNRPRRRGTRRDDVLDVAGVVLATMFG
jgi:hypothetical protein